MHKHNFYQWNYWHDAYSRIEKFYGDKKARRSKLPLIKHIHDGIAIMRYLGASEESIAAYCIHPLIQSDTDIVKNKHLLIGLHSNIVLLAMEYRWIANLYLSDRKIHLTSEIQLSPLGEVQEMLIADKVQNRKDFEAYHLGKHPRSEKLLQYFKNWLYRLEVSPDMYQIYSNLEGEYDVFKYFEKRAEQLKTEGLHWDGSLREIENLGYETFFFEPSYTYSPPMKYYAVYVLPQNRGKGRMKEYILKEEQKNKIFLTSKVCKTKEFYKKFKKQIREVGKDWTE